VCKVVIGLNSGIEVGYLCPHARFIEIRSKVVAEDIYVPGLTRVMTGNVVSIN
jgi:hypothetical protein